MTKAPKLKKEDGLIDWSKSAEQVVRQVRAMQPWPTAYTYLRHADKTLRLTVQRAVAINREPEMDHFPARSWLKGITCLLPRQWARSKSSNSSRPARNE